MSLPWLLVASALLQNLPSSEQLTLPSLPKGLADALSKKVSVEDPSFATFNVRRLPSADAVLWIVGLPCAAQTRHGRAACVSELYVQRGQTFSSAGETRGELVEADSRAGLPDQLFFYGGEGTKETRLRLKGDRYETSVVQHRFRDPLTQETLSADELRRMAYEDLKSNNSASAAGRFAILCEASCEVADLEALAAGDLMTRLFPQAEVALRSALARPGHQAQDWQSLASLLRAKGANAEAADAEARFQEETAAGTKKAKE